MRLVSHRKHRSHHKCTYAFWVLRQLHFEHSSANLSATYAVYGIWRRDHRQPPAQNQQHPWDELASTLNWRWKRNFNCSAFSNLFIYTYKLDCSNAHTHTAHATINRIFRQTKQFGKFNGKSQNAGWRLCCVNCWCWLLMSIAIRFKCVKLSLSSPHPNRKPNQTECSHWFAQCARRAHKQQRR